MLTAGLVLRLNNIKLQLDEQKRFAQDIETVDKLVIDEISMLSLKTFEQSEITSQISEESPSPPSPSPPSPSPSPPKRGRGRGRPASRRTGRRGSVRTGGRGSRRGRQSGGSGRDHDKRAEAAITALQARKQRIKNQVDSMSEENVRAVLQEVLEKQPSLIFDILEPPQQSGGHHPSPDHPSPSWCVCMRCREMPTDPEKVCCQRNPGHCLSQTPDMEVLVLDEAVLAIARLHRQDILALPEDADMARSNRHTAYRQFVLWQHGRLGVGVRTVVPSCCVWRIRDKFPDPFGQYTGFLAGRFA